MDVVIDVRKVIPGDFLGSLVNPDFPTQFPISALVGNFMGFVDNLHISHDASYHGWQPSAAKPVTDPGFRALNRLLATPPDNNTDHAKTSQQHGE
jgi:hypothetical protein